MAARKLFILSDFDDVRETRAAADRLSDLADGDSSDVNRVLYALDALRLEIRAAAQHVSGTVGAFFDELEQREGRR